MPGSRLHRLFQLGALTVAALLPALSGAARAHEVPATVTVRAFVHPEGRLLRIVIRAPLESMRDVSFPLSLIGELPPSASQPALRQAARQWLADYLAVFEDGKALAPPSIAAVRLSLPADPSFGSYPAALAHVTRDSLESYPGLPWQQAMLDVVLEFEISRAEARFALEPAWGHLGRRTTTVIRYLPPDGPERGYQFTGNRGRIHLDPEWYRAAWNFVALGFGHILEGLDHLLFLFCLVIPVRRLVPLVTVVTAFTVGHSITLAGSALGLTPNALWFPALVETLIAASILYLAIENGLGAKVERRWALAFGFGLVHGFGFSFALRESLQFAGGHLLTALFGFNLGVELGQLLVVSLTVPVLVLLFRKVPSGRALTILLSVLVGHVAWHWMAGRWSELRAYQFRWPLLTPALVGGMLRLLALLLIAGGAAWLFAAAANHLARRRRAAPAELADSPAP